MTLLTHQFGRLASRGDPHDAGRRTNCQYIGQHWGTEIPLAQSTFMYEATRPGPACSISIPRHLFLTALVRSFREQLQPFHDARLRRR